MKELEERNEPLAGALLRNNFFATLGADKSSLKKLIDEIDKINPETYPEEEDLIGRVYEYFLQAYAVAAKKEDGEFYTPACIVQLIAELIEPCSGTVYDPCCGLYVIIMTEANSKTRVNFTNLQLNNKNKCYAA